MRSLALLRRLRSTSRVDVVASAVVPLQRHFFSGSSEGDIDRRACIGESLDGDKRCSRNNGESNSAELLHAKRFFSTGNANQSNFSVQTDFFGEPVTFLDNDNMVELQRSGPAAMTALDEFLVCVVSKGKSCGGLGGDDFGLATQAAHSSAMKWAQLLQHSFEFHKTAPMLACVAVGPLLAQTGVAYTGFVDKLLAKTTSVMTSTTGTGTETTATIETTKPLSLLDLAKAAVEQKEDPNLSPREQWHLEALDCMLQQNLQGALSILLKLLQHCPGDALALSLAMDVASIVGNKEAALRAAGTVASYWHERGGLSRQSIAGYSIGTSYIALGFAVGGRFAEAERLADRALQQDSAGCGGIATCALTHAYDAEGRTSESISLLVGFDGVEQYQACGWLFFDSHLGGYGARFSLDREGLSGGKVALRVYDNNFERVLQYSGFAQGQPWTEPKLRAPTKRRDRVVQRVEKGTRSMFQQLFGESEEEEKPSASTEVVDTPSVSASVEDVLSWLPPTPKMLTDATLLLLRLTINGTVAPNDARWMNLRNAWSSMIDIHENDTDTNNVNSSLLEFYPLANVASNLLINRKHQSDSTERLANIGTGLHVMGNLMGLGVSTADNTDSSETLEAEKQQQWAKVVQLLSGFSKDDTTLGDLEGWDLEIRPIVEHALCYAASLSQDHDCLCIARAICSKGVCLRPNSPEEWWRYSVILEQLGDEVAAEDARSASVSLGSGEGSSL